MASSGGRALLAGVIVAASAVLLANAHAATSDVSIEGRRFTPDTVEINNADSVRWTNNDSVTHTVTSDSGVWTSRTVDPGTSVTITFTPNGDATYGYHCQIHPDMQAFVHVHGTPITPSPSGGPTATPSSSPGATPTPGNGSPGPTPTLVCSPPPGSFLLQIGDFYADLDGLWQESNGKRSLQRKPYVCASGTIVPPDTRIVGISS